MRHVKGLVSMVIALSVAGVGCGGRVAGEGGDPNCPIPNRSGCAQPRGVYAVGYNERRDGTCGAKPDVELTVEGARVASFMPPCTGTVVWSSDYCSAELEADCPEEETGVGFTNHQVSRTRYSADALARTGTFELTIFDAGGNVYCESTYDTMTVNTSCQP